MRDKIRNTLLLISGWLSLVIGLIGVMLPLLPTTPFLLLSAYCFSRSSERLHNWLMQHPRFGPVLREWEQHRAMARPVKQKAILLVLLTFSVSLIFAPLGLLGKALLVGLALALCLYLVRLPEPDTAQSG